MEPILACSPGSVVGGGRPRSEGGRKVPREAHAAAAVAIEVSVVGVDSAEFARTSQGRPQSCLRLSRGENRTKHGWQSLLLVLTSFPPPIHRHASIVPGTPYDGSLNDTQNKKKTHTHT